MGGGGGGGRENRERQRGPGRLGERVGERVEGFGGRGRGGWWGWTDTGSCSLGRAPCLVCGRQRQRESVSFSLGPASQTTWQRANQGGVVPCHWCVTGGRWTRSLPEIRPPASTSCHFERLSTQRSCRVRPTGPDAGRAPADERDLPSALLPLPLPLPQPCSGPPLIHSSSPH